MLGLDCGVNSKGKDLRGTISRKRKKPAKKEKEGENHWGVKNGGVSRGKVRGLI